MFNLRNFKNSSFEKENNDHLINYKYIGNNYMSIDSKNISNIDFKSLIFLIKGFSKISQIFTFFNSKIISFQKQFKENKNKVDEIVEIPIAIVNTSVKYGNYFGIMWIIVFFQLLIMIFQILKMRYYYKSRY